MARLVDFEYNPYPKPTVDGALGWAQFNIGGDAPWYEEFERRGGHSDFAEALAQFRARVPWARRHWNARQKLWGVQITGQIKDALCDIFDNAFDLFQQAEMQLGLFD